MISGYLGKSNAFDQALGKFALAYTDRTEKDDAALVEAAESGRLIASLENYASVQNRIIDKEK